MKRLHAILALTGATAVAPGALVRAGINASQVIGTYAPGDLADSGDAQWDNPSAALGALSGDTLQGYGALTPFNPAFDTSQIVGIGPGGELTLQLSAAIPVGSSPTLGVFSNDGLVDTSSNGTGVAGNPATTFDDPDHPAAIVSVSSDGVHFVLLNGGNPITFSNPANYFTDQSMSHGTEPLGLAVADQYQPFTGSLSGFNGETFNQIKTTLNGSAGGTWLSLAGTGLSTVTAVRFAVSTDLDVPMFVDSVAGVSTQATDLWNNTGGSGDGKTWDTVQPNWNNGSLAVTYNDYTYPSAQGDTVIFNDNNAGNFNVSIPGIVHPASVVVNNSLWAYNFSGNGGIAGIGSLTKTGSAGLILATSNTYTGATNVSAGSLVLAVAGALPKGTLLTIGSGASVVAQNSSGTITIASLALAGSSGHWTGKLDLGNNQLLVEAGNLPMLTDQLKQGYEAGSWNGAGGIVSTAAANDASHLRGLGIASVGEAVEIDYTYYGDVNLDGVIDGLDYSVIDSSYLREATTNTPVTAWSNGDFNYDGVVDGSDYTLMDNAFNQQGAQSTSEIAIPTEAIAIAVPDPAGMGMGLIVAALLGRRRRR